MDRTIVICKILQLQDEKAYGISLKSVESGLLINYSVDEKEGLIGVKEVDKHFLIRMDIEKAIKVIDGISEVEKSLKKVNYIYG